MTKEAKPAKAKKTYGKAKKSFTLSEFKAWLSGVEEMQPSNWVPDAGQWKTIRAKFEDIVESAPSNVVRDRTVYDNNNPFERGGPAPVRAAGPSAFGGGQPMQRPQQPIELANPNRPVESNDTQIDFAVPNGQKKPVVGRVKTPNIDTSAGGYQPAFE